METIKISFLHVFTIKTGTMSIFYDEYFLHVFTIETITRLVFTFVTLMAISLSLLA